MQNFLDQYNENCREYTRRTPLRFLKLAVAFVAALLLGSLCYAVEWLTGSRLAVLAVLVPGIIAIVVLWLLLLRRLDAPRPMPVHATPLSGSTPFPQPGTSSPWAPAGFPAAEVIAATAVGKPPAWNQPSAAGKQLEPAFLSPPRTSSGGGWGIALLAIAGVVALSCCGGGIVLLGIVSHVSTQVAAPEAVEMHDPFAQMHARQQQNMDDMLRRQEEQMRRMERERDRLMNRPGW